MGDVQMDVNQLEVATSEDSVVIPLAGPGAGKTTVLAAGVANALRRGFDGGRIAVLTYTTRMAMEMRARITSLMPEYVTCRQCLGSKKVDGCRCATCSGIGRLMTTMPFVGTMHSFAAKVIRDAIKAKVPEALHLYRTGVFPNGEMRIATPEDVDDVIDSVAPQAKRMKVGKRQLQAGLSLIGEQLTSWPPAAAARQEMLQRGLVCYDDLLFGLWIMADTGYLARAWPGLFLDEAQDFSRMQLSIIERWGWRSRFMAGDDAQAIYGFLDKNVHSGSVPLPDLGSFAEIVQSDPLSVYRLGRNYRSGVEITGFADSLRRVMAADGACAAMDLLPAGGDGSYGVIIASDCGVAEVVDEVKAALHRGDEPHEIAVIARTWAELELVKAALEDAGVSTAMPVRSRDRWRTIAGRGFMAMARAAEDNMLDEAGLRTILEAIGHPPGDARELAAGASLTALKRGCSINKAADDDSRIALDFAFWQRMSRAGTLGELLDSIEELDWHALNAAGMAAVAWRGQRVLPSEWLVWMASEEDQASVELRDGHVCLTTVHGAKGLEWPTVVVSGVCEGSWPGPMDRGEEGLNEASRVLYVAVTRAKKTLRVIVPTMLRGKPRSPSRWLVKAGLTPPMEDRQEEGE
jgi:DNA helicase-2/ATP-dependent DNA helicase PcrA